MGKKNTKTQPHLCREYATHHYKEHKVLLQMSSRMTDFDNLTILYSPSKLHGIVKRQ
jgi:hypothetical protein